MLKYLRIKGGGRKPRKYKDFGKEIELSICIPVYNGGERAVRCVKNVLSYKGQNIEVIVSDNASNDDTLERLSMIKDDRLKIYTNEKDIGPFRNWYKALSHGTGRYILLLQDNDWLVVDNLPQYLDFLRNSEYDIIKNAYANAEHFTGKVSVAKMQYYGKILSHAGFLTYRRETFQNLEPLECSFDPSFCAYPHFVWETQILSYYSLNAKKCFINGDIEIIRVLAKDSVSRTRGFIKKGKTPDSYTFENAVYMFDKQVGLLKSLYSDGREYSRMYCNLYRGDLKLGTFWYYEHMTDQANKERYQIKRDTDNIDYIGLNGIFLRHARQIERPGSGITNFVTNVILTIITYRNRRLFELYFVYETSLKNPLYFWGCVENKFLNMLVNMIT